MTQARFADQLNGLEQARGHVFEQDPVGGKVDVRLQAGAHLKGLLQSRPTGQIGIARRLAQALIQPAHVLFRKQLRTALHSAFGDLPYPVNLTRPAKIRQQIAASQLPRHLPKRNPSQQKTQHFQAQRPYPVSGTPLLILGTGLFPALN